MASLYKTVPEYEAIERKIQFALDKIKTQEFELEKLLCVIRAQRECVENRERRESQS